VTQREQQILDLLKTDPMISQRDLAGALGITRSAVAVHITNLIKKGHILGKGYVLSEGPYVCVIGGSNVDIQGFPERELIQKDSNIGKVRISLGGVGRNIAENLVRMGVDTRLISVIGDDAYGMKIVEEARQIGLNLQDTLILKGEQTSTYLSILDQDMDMALAVNDMSIIDRMTVDFIKSKRHVIEHAALCILDTNIPASVLAYVLTTFPNTTFFLDTVSTVKARKVTDLVGRVHTIKPNRLEAEILSGMPIRNEVDLEPAVAVLHKKGVRNIFVTLGEGGIVYSDGGGLRRQGCLKVKLSNATGAGDAGMAALALGYLRGANVDEMAKLAMAASAIAISSENTINPAMSEELLDSRVKELESC
jgi:pseudouridine kinase